LQYASIGKAKQLNRLFQGLNLFKRSDNSKIKRSITMIVERMTILVKPGCQEAVVKILKEGSGDSYRIYTPYISLQDVVIVEWGYENLQELEAAWDEWFAKYGTPEFFERWYQLVEQGGHREVFRLAEHG
jgi:hypothetical protein